MFAKKYFLIVTALLLLALGLSFVSPQVNAADDPVAIVQAYYDAINAGDLEKATAYYADTYISIGPWGKYIGKKEGIDGLALTIDGGLQFELSNFRNDNGRVIYAYRVLSGDSLVDSGDNGLVIFRDGKIVLDALTSYENQWSTAVVEGYYGAYNKGDIDLAVQYLADDVVFINPTGTYKGKDAARANLEAIKKDGLTFELSNLQDTNGRVVYSYKVLIGGEAVETGTGGLTKVLNGLIVFDGTTETENQLPTTGADFSMSALWWVALSGVILVALGAMFLKRKTA